MSLVDDHFETVVLLGCCGSGKSYLALALRMMPETLFLDELVFPPCLAYVLGQNLAPETRNAIRAGLVANMLAFANAGTTRSRLHALADYALKNISPADLMLKLKRRYRVRRFVIESNFFSFVPEFFCDSLERVKIIHMVRDGRLCAAKLSCDFGALSDEKLKGLRSPEALLGSYHPVAKRYTPSWLPADEADAFQDSSSYLRCVWFWRELVSRVQHYIDAAPADQAADMMTVKFEALADSPRQTLADISAFLSGTSGKRHELSLRPVRTDRRLQRRLATLESADLAKAYEIAKSQLDFFGYGKKCTLRG
jgi:hypothetical protein